MVANIDPDVKYEFDSPKTHRSRKSKTTPSSNKLALCSGAKVKPKRYGKQPPPQPPTPVLTIGKRISLALTLEQYGIQPNAQTVRRIGGAE